MSRTPSSKFLLCLDNRGYEASLERRKVYQCLPDAEALDLDQVRVVDESGEDYLFPKRLFAPITISPTLRKAAFAMV